MSGNNLQALPTYIVNLPQRTDRREYILQQFENRDEFSITLVEACVHKIGAVGLWNSINNIIDVAIAKDEEIIVICEDDHQFTQDYNKEYLFNNIKEACNKGVDLFLGGIGGCTYAMPVAKNRFWVERFICTQFTVIHKDFFGAIKEEMFTDQDAADDKLSSMTINKMVIYPFVSTQKEFGYSDVSKDANRPPVTGLFEAASSFLEKIQKIYTFYTG